MQGPGARLQRARIRRNRQHATACAGLSPCTLQCFYDLDYEITKVICTLLHARICHAKIKQTPPPPPPPPAPRGPEERESKGPALTLCCVCVCVCVMCVYFPVSIWSPGIAPS